MVVARHDRKALDDRDDHVARSTEPAESLGSRCRLYVACSGEVQTAPVPRNRVSVPGKSVGYVQHIYMQALAKLAKEADCPIWIATVPGRFVREQAELAVVDKASLDEATISAIPEAFVIGRNRVFEQDPRFGPVVLSEIAIHAISPSLNDPGTAIDVIGRLVRVLSPWRAEKSDAPKSRVSAPLAGHWQYLRGVSASSLHQVRFS